MLFPKRDKSRREAVHATNDTEGLPMLLSYFEFY
jgi:hypothetical protein